MQIVYLGGGPKELEEEGRECGVKVSALGEEVPLSKDFWCGPCWEWEAGAFIYRSHPGT